ncbi:HEAT repeat domain-containing protein [Leptospira weilii]|nr:HEAT repeat domain-containing protein [Leptospira weilii]
MEDLETLDMAYCNLSEISEGFAKLANLSRFDFEGSRVENVPSDVLYAGVETIQKFLNKTPDKKQKKIPVTDSSEFKISLEQHKGSLEKFYRDVKDKMYQDDTRKKLEALRKFFSGEIDEVPKSIAEDHYYFGTLPDVLAPYRKWTAIDFRILAYITQSAWSFKKNEAGFFEAFYKWLGREVLNDPEDSQLFSDILNALKEYGVDETKLLAERKYKIQEIVFASDHRITSFGRYLLEHFDEIISDFMKESLPSQFVDLFVREKFEKIEPLISQITKIKEYDSSDGKKHVPHRTIEILCKAKPALTESIILDRIEAIDCVSCKAELNRILYESFRDKYKQKVVDSAKVTLDYISERKNKNLDRGYDFDWPLSKEFYRDDTSDYIEWLLKNFGSDLKTEIFNYVEKTKVLDLNVVGVAVKYLGQDAVDIAGEALDMTIKNDDIAGHFRQAFNILSNLDYSKYYDKTWEIVKSEFKKVSETACLTLSRLLEKQVVPKALELLNEKQAHVREAGALVLSLLSTLDSVESLKPLLEKEKNDDIRNLVVGVVYKAPVELGFEEAKRRISVAKALGKLDKPLAKWLDESKLPEILWKDQKPLSEEEIRYLFYRQKTVPAIEMDLELRDVVALIDKSSCEKFSKSLLSLILKNGGFKAPNRFAISILEIWEVMMWFRK